METEKKNAWKIKYLERYGTCKAGVEEAREKEKELWKMRCPAIEEQYQAAVVERKKAEEELPDAYKEVLSIIETLEDKKERKVLILIYVRGKKWKEAAEDMSYSERQIKRIHGNAVDHLKMSRNAGNAGNAAMYKM